MPRSSDRRGLGGALLGRVSFLIVACLLGAATTLATAADPSMEYRLKAAFLLNFPNFVEWPATAFASPNDPVVLGIFGKDPFEGALEEMAGPKVINGRSVTVRVTSDVRELRNCHVVFFPASVKQKHSAIQDALAGLSILTVSEVPGFAERGGIVNFVVENRHVRFEVNPSAAQVRRIKMSSKLLQLATIVGNSQAATK